MPTAEEMAEAGEAHLAAYDIRDADGNEIVWKPGDPDPFDFDDD